MLRYVQVYFSAAVITRRVNYVAPLVLLSEISMSRSCHMVIPLFQELFLCSTWSMAPVPSSANRFRKIV